MLYMFSENVLHGINGFDCICNLMKGGIPETTEGAPFPPFFNRTVGDARQAVPNS